jgi:catechol 2,3-dioxygenase-like lactoylglutathione lyase family enzyme
LSGCAIVLKSIYIVTLVVLSLARSEQAYETNLGYETVARGELSAELAGAWHAPDAAGAPWLLMKPGSDSEVFIRFIEAGGKGNYEPMKTLGWNAVEIQAQDPDRLATELDPQAFEIIGPPAFLTDKQNIRAMQVLGPDRELLYLTHVLDPAQSTFNIGTAQSYVDRVFIMVLGTADLAATATFYSDQLGQSLSGPWPYRVSVLSRAWGLPAETLYDLSIAQLQEPFLVEIDQYPAEAARREPTDIGLPFGPAIVSFRVDSLVAPARRAGRDPMVPREAPYAGLATVLLQGPSGELVELIGPAP